MAFAALFGYLNGLFAGTAYQAPMLAAQLYFPDRKGLVSKILLFGMASGIGLYSYLTSQWASSAGDSSICDVKLLTRYLGACMLGHTALASALLSMPSKQIKNDDLRQLKYNLLNAQEFESEGPAGQAGGSGAGPGGSRGFTGGAARPRLTPPASVEQQ